MHLTEKYNWNTYDFLNLQKLNSKPEVHLKKYTSQIDVFLFKLKSQVYFQN